ncbi:MAG: NUDIX domain-containing protein [Chloroflexi bacterium]|nr:NUDIX domain-containing protein [Chloroflexota bacterium]MCY4247992.1 NUDIX domain-containing protein [Chloroflexota bacterium]
MSRIANYCEVCGGRLIQQRHGGRIRPYCQVCQQPTYFDPKVAVIIFALRDEEVLLVQRAMDPGAGKWALPAGFIDYDEAPEDAAIRETWEETGLQVVIRKLLAVFPKRDDGLADISIAYSAEIIGGEAKAGDDAADLGFFAAKRLPPLVFFPSVALVAQWRAGELALQP